MPGEIASAYLAIVPSMRGFGSGIVQQGGPQIAMAGRQLGARGGAALGASLGGSAARSAIPVIGQVNAAIGAAQRNTGSWLTDMGQMAVKNVAIYGSMYAAIQGIRVGIGAMFDNMVGFNAQLEQSSIGFTTLLKSSAAAEDQMAWIKSFAKESPFRYDNLVGYSQQLIALGFNAEESRKVLVAAGDAAAALGRGDESIARINLALGQMWTKGKVQSQEMLQLTESGIGAWQILANAYGSTVAEVQDRVTAGLITAKEAVPALIAGMEDQFGGLMEAQAKTFTGVWSNIQDTIQQQLAEAGEPLFDQLKVAGQEFLQALDDPAVKEFLTGFGDELADTAKVLVETGTAAATAFKDALPFLREVWSNAKQSLPVLVAMAAAFYAVRKAQAGGFGAGLFGGIVAESRAAAAAVTAVTVPTKAMVVAQKAALASSIELGVAKQREALATTAASQATQLAATGSTSATKLAAAAQNDLNASTNARLAANAQLVVSENAVTAATEKAIISQRRLAAVGAGFRQFAGLGQTLGLVGLTASITAVGDAAAPTEQKVAGLAGAFGTGALTGAAFGSVIPGVGTAAGAAAGAVVGLTAALVNLQAAQDAANKDTSATATVLEQIGVSAANANKLLSALGNDGLESLGGSQAVVDAIQKRGVDYDQLIAKVTALKKAQEAVRDQTVTPFNGKDIEDARTRVAELTSALDALRPSATDAAYSQFLATEAANASTGAYGEQAAAAYRAATAFATIPPAMMQTGIAAEGASGKVGYLLAALTGLPVNTPINFSTNATDILARIYALQASIIALRADGDARIATMQSERLRALQRELAKSLTASATSAPTLTLPSYSGAASKAASAASSAASDAARKLERDRNAQLQFADAFGSLMESALGGEFDRYRDKLADQIQSLTRDGYTKAAAALKDLSGTLTQSALDYAALTNKLKSATDAYDDLTGRMQDQYNTSRDLITGLGKATDAQSFDQLAYLLGETTNAATQYQDVLAQLKAQGLSEDLWNQLAQSGPESMGLAQSILAQGQSGIDQLNSLSGGLVDAADSMGSLVSQSMFQQGVDAMNAYIDGLKSGQAALTDQLVTIGNNVLDKTAGAITPGNAGYLPITGGTQTTANNYVNVTIDASDLDDLTKIQNFLAMLEAAPTTQLVDAAGKVVS